jgi:hypothetical protein
MVARVRSERSCCGGRRTALAGAAFFGFDETESILVFYSRRETEDAFCLWKEERG